MSNTFKQSLEEAALHNGNSVYIILMLKQVEIVEGETSVSYHWLRI